MSVLHAVLTIVLFLSTMCVSTWTAEEISKNMFSREIICKNSLNCVKENVNRSIFKITAWGTEDCCAVVAELFWSLGCYHINLRL